MDKDSYAKAPFEESEIYENIGGFLNRVYQEHVFFFFSLSK